MLKHLLLTIPLAVAIWTVVPANAQSGRAKNDGGKKCWIQTDPSRPAGYYGSCKGSMTVRGAKQPTRHTASPPVGVIDPRESSSGGGGGGY